MTLSLQLWNTTDNWPDTIDHFGSRFYRVAFKGTCCVTANKGFLVLAKGTGIDNKLKVNSAS